MSAYNITIIIIHLPLCYHTHIRTIPRTQFLGHIVLQGQMISLGDAYH